MNEMLFKDMLYGASFVSSMLVILVPNNHKNTTFLKS